MFFLVVSLNQGPNAWLLCRQSLESASLISSHYLGLGRILDLQASLTRSVTSRLVCESSRAQVFEAIPPHMHTNKTET